ncbi:MAG: helix-turn-helix domain-containing protein [Acidobacteriia bacterium]|nr:helix-turn-helix domain-containing protein [Terriglobia bacterium]
MGARGKLAAEAAAATLDLFKPVSATVQGGIEREARLSSQRERILALLRERGRAGITNTELNELCFRYGARIFELRRAGQEIETIDEGAGVFRFVLKSSPRPGAGPAVGEPQRPNAARNGRQDRPQEKMFAAAQPAPEAELASAPVYESAPLDLVHAMLRSQKFAQYGFLTDYHGDIMCPGCHAGMLRAEKRKGFAQHFVCPRSGLAFYGDHQGLSLCLNPAQDVAGRLCQAAI